MEIIRPSSCRGRTGRTFKSFIATFSAARSRKRRTKEISFVSATNFYIAFLYGDVPDESEFLRTARSVWLEIKSDDVEQMRQKILDSGLVKKLERPDPHLYFQAPGGQCLRLVDIDEDLSLYEGAGAGPDVAKIKEAFKKEAMKK